MTKMSETLKKLLPPGALPDEDERAHALIEKLGLEYQRIKDRLDEVVGSIPDQTGSLDERWQKITASDNPQARLSSKGFPVNLPGKPSFYVSNTNAHFKSIGKDVEVSSAANHTRICGITNKRTSLRCGGRSNAALAEFRRDEDIIDTYERVRHAHIKITYEESTNA